MKSKTLLPAAVLFASLALSCALGARRQAPPSAVETTMEAAPFAYLLRCEPQCSESQYSESQYSEEQNLALFCLSQGENTNVWEKIADFPVMLEDLPETDRQWLRAGIALRNAQELQRALEDYLPVN